MPKTIIETAGPAHIVIETLTNDAPTSVNTCASTSEKPAPKVASDGLTPQQRWRQKNIDHVRAKQREYQKAYRARKRAEK